MHKVWKIARRENFIHILFTCVGELVPVFAQQKRGFSRLCAQFKLRLESIFLRLSPRLLPPNYDDYEYMYLVVPR